MHKVHLQADGYPGTRAFIRRYALSWLICYFLKIFHWLIEQRADKLGGLSISSVTFWSACFSLQTMPATQKGFSIMSWGHEPKLFAFDEWVPGVSTEFLMEMWLQAEHVGPLNKTQLTTLTKTNYKSVKSLSETDITNKPDCSFWLVWSITLKLVNEAKRAAYSPYSSRIFPSPSPLWFPWLPRIRQGTKKLS